MAAPHSCSCWYASPMLNSAGRKSDLARPRGPTKSDKPRGPSFHRSGLHFCAMYPVSDRVQLLVRQPHVEQRRQKVRPATPEKGRGPLQIRIAFRRHVSQSIRNDHVKLLVRQPHVEQRRQDLSRTGPTKSDKTRGPSFHRSGDHSRRHTHASFMYAAPSRVRTPQRSRSTVNGHRSTETTIRPSIVPDGERLLKVSDGVAQPTHGAEALPQAANQPRPGGERVRRSGGGDHGGRGDDADDGVRWW
jgi:hypothetical protein